MEIFLSFQTNYSSKPTQYRAKPLRYLKVKQNDRKRIKRQPARVAISEW